MNRIDYFAAAALQGLIASRQNDDEDAVGFICEAWRIAEQMEDRAYEYDEAARSIIGAHTTGGPAAILADAIYTTAEAAHICRVEPSTIRNAVRSGIIQGRGRPFRIRGSELFKLSG